MADLQRDTIAVVLAFHRGDRDALAELLKGYPTRSDHLALMGALSGLVTLAVEDILKLTASMEGADGLADLGFNVEDALERMALRMAAADG